MQLIVEVQASVRIVWPDLSLLEKEGHGFMNLRNAMKQSCDIYFYEIARKLGVDKLSETAKNLDCKEVFGDLFSIEKKV